MPVILRNFGKNEMTAPMAMNIRPNSGKNRFLKPASRMSNTLTKWPGLGAAFAAATQHAIPNNKPQRRKQGIIAHRVGTVDQAGGPLSRIIHDHITGRSAFARPPRPFR